MKFLKKSILTMAAVAALTIGTSGATFASSDVNARIEALESALKELRAEVASRDAKIEAMEAKTAEIDKLPKFSDTKLAMESRDGQFSMGIAGRFQADAYAIDDDSSATNPMGNGMELRRIRLGVNGKMFGAWKYKLDVEYAGDKVAVKDAYVETDLAEGLGLKVGHFKEYYGIDNMTSDNYVSFMERATSSIYWPDQNMGFGLAYSDGELFGVQGGMWTPGVANGGAGGSSDWSVTGRAYMAPKVGSAVIHAGLNGSYRGFEASTTTKFEQRPEAHAAEKVLRTGNITSPVSETRFGPEVAAIFGPVTLQAQYDWSEIERANGLATVSTEGGYAEASWFVTGESRNYSVKNGAFGRTKATDAIQLAARVSYLDLDDAALTDLRRGTETNTTLGVNYYFNPSVRLMLNWVRADVDYTAAPDETYNIVQSRLQLDW
jgi:phosphate-selective porin OprO/OprP